MGRGQSTSARSAHTLLYGTSERRGKRLSPKEQAAFQAALQARQTAQAVAADRQAAKAAEAAWQHAGGQIITRGPGTASQRNEWWMNNQLGREGGPAIEWANGRNDWYRNGQLHREDGPAVEGPDGQQQWFISGKELTEAQWQAHYPNA